MTTGWLLASLLVLPVAACAAALLRRTVDVPTPAAVVVNGLLPGSGLALLDRPLLEVALCVLMGEAAMVVAGGTAAAGSLVPFMVVAAGWAAAYTPLNPIHASRRDDTGTVTPPPGKAAPVGSKTAPATAAGADGGEPDGPAADIGYAVAVRCTECGAEVEVPVLQHMASCRFCGSDHVVIGHDEVLWLTLPATAHDEPSLRESLLDHYRYQEYLKLYRRSVAPLERQATEVSPTGALVTRPDASAAAAAAEAAVTRRADVYRARLAETLSVRVDGRFLSPYRHGVGTLYQTTFGREPTTHDKRLRFTVGTVEAAISATDALDLPKMGKLSYLKALRPAAACDPELRSLPLDRGDDDLVRGFGDLDRKRLDRTLQAIRTGSRFRRDVAAVVWRPWWIAAVAGPGIDDRLLVDGATGSVVGPAPFVDPDQLEPLPDAARSPGTGLRFVPMECPACGDEFPFDHDAVVHFCANCHRAFELHGSRKVERGYARDATLDDADSSEPVPFWRFPLRVRTADGELITDLWRLKDGIDGTFDQIDEAAAVGRAELLVPAIRCINSRLTAVAYNRLFRWSLQHRTRVERGRFPLEASPRPWTVSLDHDDARQIAPLYLANAFGRRDLAKVNVHQVSAWLLDAELEADGELYYASVATPVTEPFRPYLGRGRAPALSSVVS